jgi:RNA polymerase sigma factor (sigma-70 family)
MATARRYSATPEDAEDAYQRALEILLTKAPPAGEEELVPWLRTVVKHEAFALRRQRERHSPVTSDGRLSERGTPETDTHERAERWERLSQGAEAIGRLKPQELRALLLKAEGYSYREICEITGWTYTKVNRCLSEGRQAFLERLDEIQTGAECERMAERLSALADGEATAEDLALLRPHLRTCLACRSRLKEYRSAPERVAALVPPALLATAAGHGGGLRSLLESLLGAVQHKTAALGERAQAAAELATGQKMAAVAASAAALAGGGTAVDRIAAAPPHRPAHAAERHEVRARPAMQPPAGAEAEPAPPGPAPAPVPAPAAPPAEPAPAPAPPAPAPAQEFDPVAAQAARAPAPAPAPAPADQAFAPGGGAPGGGGGGGGEFAP